MLRDARKIEMERLTREILALKRKGRDRGGDYELKGEISLLEERRKAYLKTKIKGGARERDVRIKS